MGAKTALAPSRVIPFVQEAVAPAWYTSLSMLAVDLTALSAVYWLAVIGRYLITPGSFRLYFELFPGMALFILAFCIQGLYPGVLLHPAEEIRRISHCVSTVFLLVLCTTFIWHTAEWYSRSIFLITWALGAPAVLLARCAGRRLLSRSAWWGVPAVVFGSGSAAQRVLRTLRNRRLGVRVTAVVPDGLSHPPASSAHYAIVAMAHNSELALQHIIQDYCSGYRHILLVPDLPGVCSLGISAREIGGEIGFDLPQRLFHRSAALVKRSLDLLLSIPALILLSPFFLLFSLAIRLTSHGPALYTQSRHGRDGKPFKALKFRTMLIHGDAILLEHFREHPDELAAWQRDQKLRYDPRVTAVGKWLRRCSLDELPQIFNVLLGHMSLVGPRPIVAAEVPKYGRGYGLYTRARPGITGLWQVSGRNNTTYEERVTLDEYYVRNWSIWLDAYILVRTVRAVLTAEGAY
jgi:Undecaprenyl-phosphate galactose phosphotransferase WbaP